MSEPRPNIEILRDSEAVACRAAELFLVHCEQAARDRGAFHVALSGGRTPRRLFDLLAHSRTGAAVAWERTHLFWVDERCVQPDSAQSNYRLVAETLLPHVSIPKGHVHRIRAEKVPPEAAAADYEKMLRREFQLSETSKPRFDLILLGMGPDGHTASIFPGDAESLQSEVLVRAVPEAMGVRRITLTGPVLRAGKALVVLVTGRDKAAVLADVLAGSGDERKYPIHLLRPIMENVVWLVDRDAAGELRL